MTTYEKQTFCAHENKNIVFVSLNLSCLRLLEKESNLHFVLPWRLIDLKSGVSYFYAIMKHKCEEPWQNRNLFRNSTLHKNSEVL